MKKTKRVSKVNSSKTTGRKTMNQTMKKTKTVKPEKLLVVDKRTKRELDDLINDPDCEIELLVFDFEGL